MYSRQSFVEDTLKSRATIAAICLACSIWKTAVARAKRSVTTRACPVMVTNTRSIAKAYSMTRAIIGTQGIPVQNNIWQIPKMKNYIQVCRMSQMGTVRLLFSSPNSEFHLLSIRPPKCKALIRFIVDLCTVHFIKNKPNMYLITFSPRLPHKNNAKHRLAGGNGPCCIL